MEVFGLRVEARRFPSFVVMGEANTATLHHDGGGTIVACTKVDCAFNFRGAEFVAGDHELEVDVGKHFRIVDRT